MRRRDFLAALSGAAAAWPHAARAQQARGIPTVGVLTAVVESDAESQTRITAFRQSFERLGWKDGQSVHLEYRWAAGKMDLIEQYAHEMVALNPEVILASGTPVVAALQKITGSIPIVCALVNDPVDLGFVKSLARPGGNITGFTYIEPELITKWMGLLKDATLDLRRAALLFNPATAPFYRYFLSQIETAHLPGSIALEKMPVSTPAEMESAVAVLAQRPGGSLMVGPDPFTIVHVNEIALLAANNRPPSISVYRPFAVAGGLMSYGPDTAEIFRQAASYVDRILKGDHAADLPVQQPTKFEFVVNLRAAKGLGLSFPPTLLSLADEVIE
ncbi:MAG TPA: ABC transporter substrate-binding protein [Xanthobacteraceae bacterium]|nr:ABC transporter substrate-binding protein [Xanthobacteraceae bacterium]